MSIVRSCVVLIAAMLLFSIGAPAAFAQEAGFPSRPLKLIVPYPPGASTDLISRAIAEEADKILGLSPYNGRLEDFPAKMQAELAEFISEAKQLGLEPQ